MRKYSNIILIVALIAILFLTQTIVSFAMVLPNSDIASETSNQLDSLDIMLIAYRYLAATDLDNEFEKNSIWDNTTGVRKIEPIYDTEDNILAYYVSFLPDGYIIVNNNILNPMAIEFSAIRGEEEMQLESKAKNEKLVYGILEENNFNSRTFETGLEQMEVLKYTQNMQDFLNTPNYEEQILHEELRTQLINKRGNIIPRDTDATYGIVSSANLPTGTYATRNLTEFSTTNWGTMSEFKSYVGDANNYCGATAAFNVVNYYQHRYNRSSLLYGNSRTSTFVQLFNKIGNGPVLPNTINQGLKEYVESRGSSFSYTDSNTFPYIKQQINDGKMSIMLLSSAINKWHYVNVIGYRDYSSGTDYVRIINGWQHSVDKYVAGNNFTMNYITHIS
ncbi:MAG: hypothetical protein HFE73_06365 [Firmicutes bacterium]|nr:hypothetical protein [Bacillota bacterium]